MRLFITLDYELFLGVETGSPENCLIRPMEALEGVANKHGFKYIVFVDAAYLLRLWQLRTSYPQLNKDFELVSNHVKYLALQGHDIQLHFHPQWLYSEYNDIYNKWQLKSIPYKLSDMKEEDAFLLFHEAKKLLDEIIGYKTSAFRAGGYCLASFSGYKKLFKQEDIRIDSSVARYGYVETAVHAYDYRDIPSKIIYNFDSDVCKEQVGGKFTELSITSTRWSGLEYMLKVRTKMASYNPKMVYGDGKSVSDGRKRMNIFSKILKFVRPYKNLASIDGIRSCQLEKVLEKEKGLKREALVLIGHPKLTSDVSIANLDSFIGNHVDLNICTTSIL